MKNSETPINRPHIKQPVIPYQEASNHSILLHKAFKAEFPAFSSSIVYKKKKTFQTQLRFCKLYFSLLPNKMVHKKNRNSDWLSERSKNRLQKQFWQIAFHKNYTQKNSFFSSIKIFSFISGVSQKQPEKYKYMLNFWVHAYQELMHEFLPLLYGKAVLKYIQAF